MNDNTTNKITTLQAFCNFYFSHPALESLQDPYIRISLLPSRYLISKAKARPRAEEYVVPRSQLTAALNRLIAVNEKGWDVYYFANLAQPLIGQYIKNSDITQRLYLALDLDYRLPLEPLDLMNQFGLAPAAIIRSSNRENEFPHYNILLGLDAEGADEASLHHLAREFCAVFGSDPIHDAKRILRMPGTINWKHAEVAVTAASTARLIHVCDSPTCWPVDEITHAIQSFAKSKLSDELQLLGLRSVARGGICEGEKGDYGSWATALEEAEAGKWSVSSGSRHNALCSWALQMSVARLPLPVVLQNLETLRGKAFEVPYDEDYDFERIKKSVSRKWHEMDAELDSVFSSDPEVPEPQTATEIEAETEELLIAPKEPLTIPVGEKGEEAIHRQTPIEMDDGEEEGQAPVLDQRFVWNFARRLAAPFAGESDADYVSFLASVIISANQFRHKDSSTIVPLGQVIMSRLILAGCCSHPNFSVPLQVELPLRHWTMFALDRDSACVLLRDMLASLAVNIIELRKEISALPVVQEKIKKNKRFKVIFNPGPLEIALLRDVLGRAPSAALATAANRMRSWIMSFQNGWLDLRPWYKINGNGCSPSLAESLLQATWHPNGPAAQGHGRTGNAWDPKLSWVKNDWSLAVDFNFEAAIKICRGESSGLKHPIWNRFINDAFPAEIQTWQGLLRILGYCFLLDNPLQKYFYLEGIAGSGKGTLAELILTLVGNRNAGRIDTMRVLSDAWLGPLAGKTVVLIDEAESIDIRLHRRLMSEIARVTGGDLASGRSLNRDAGDILCGHKFLITTNRGLETDDIAGQQARRIVPLNFAHAPSTVVNRLYLQIAKQEGSAVATRAVCELLPQLHRGQDMFTFEASEDDEALGFVIGRERFVESSGGLALVLSQIIKRAKNQNVPSLLLFALAEVWAKQQKNRKQFLNNIDRSVGAEMNALGFYKGAIRCEMPATAEGATFCGRSRGFQDCRIDTPSVLSALETSGEELLRSLWFGCIKQRKIWILAQSYLDLPPALFTQVDEDLRGKHETPTVISQDLFPTRDGDLNF